MFRKRILLASLLKPVNDTRMYAKLGQSIAKLPSAEVHVAGFHAPLPEQNAITFHPIFNFNRISWQRLRAQWSFWKLLKQLRPQVVVVCTHELLPLAWWYKKNYGGQLVYDIQENYQLNLETQHVYGSFFGKGLGKLVRCMESALAPAVDYFLLAEASYAQELPFIDRRFTVLQNKYKPPGQPFAEMPHTPVRLKGLPEIQLLYTGTISQLYGVMKAISWAEQFHQFAPNSSLTIIGYAPDQKFLQQVRARIASLPFVQLIGGDALVPHSQILEWESKSHLGLMPYHPHPSTQRCLPTKLYEYLANGLVVIAQNNPLWEQVLQENQAGACLDFKQPLSQATIEQILQNTYYSKGIPKDVFWQQEEEELLSVIEMLLRK
ncbi:glycosyltransferase [Nibribacter ruber]|uniref:Glycosyltransferase n=1 Tax=Nibribacter ruber TaxID=2698458 RepID=A0A6P1NVB7_9BACT|nr:glycosyltransferase family 4 protein [Nibribacter ruber]QHL86284.1 glycosyltransferase [Nibribacter ruber]